MGAAAGHGQGRPCPLPGPRGAQTGSRVRGSRHEERGAPGPWGGRELGPSGGGTACSWTWSGWMGVQGAGSGEPHLSRSDSRRSPLGRHTGRPRRRSRSGLRAGRGWSCRHPPLENTQRVGQGSKGVSGGGRRGQREEGKGRRGEVAGGGGGQGPGPPLVLPAGVPPPPTQACPRAPSPPPALSSPASVLVGNRFSQVSRVS